MINIRGKTIKKEKDYSKFLRIGGNRKVSKSHVKSLTEAIKSDPSCVTYNPIIVNEKMEIIDGQHRFEAIKQLDLPVYYLQEPGLTLDNVQALNAKTKPWSPMDYARSFSELGNKSYSTYIDFKVKYKFNHDILMSFLSLENPITVDSFRNGKLKVDDVDKSHDLCQKLIDIAPLYERYNYRSFAFAFKMVWSHPEYDHKRMIEKLKDKKLDDYTTVTDYARALESIYNHALPSQKKLRFF